LTPYRYAFEPPVLFSPSVAARIIVPLHLSVGQHKDIGSLTGY